MKPEGLAPICESFQLGEKDISEIQRGMPDEDCLLELSELFKLFGDSTRIKIIYTLSKKEICVCDIATLLGMSQSSISHQLRALRNARIVKSRRDGKQVYYSLDDDHVKYLFSIGLDHISER